MDLFKPSPKKVADKHLYPQETIQWAESRLRSSGLDIFQELRRVDKGRLGIPVYMSIYGAKGIEITGHVKQMGKGATEDLARASALMELVERYSLFKKIKTGSFIKATLEELGETAISVESLLASVLDPNQDRKEKEIAAKFLPKIPLHWTQALEVASSRERFLPIYWFWLLYEYNGSSAGNSLAEAAVQGTCEVIERHVCALTSHKKLKLPEIEIAEISEEAKKLLNCYKNLGIKLYLRDMTLGMPIPTVAALAYDPTTYPSRSEIVYTAGTATSPERALIRALTEVAQLAGDFDTEGRYLESGLPKYHTLEQAEVIIAEHGKISLTDLPDLSRADHAEELKVLAKELDHLGYSLFVCDLTDHELDIPVIYAILPGAHFRQRLFLSPLYQLIRVVSLYLEPYEALKVLKEIESEIHPRYYLASYLGQILKTLRFHEEAIEQFKKALSLSPSLEDLPAIYCHLAHTYLELSRYPDAQEIAEEAISLTPLPELYNILGTALFRQGNIAKALEAYMKSLELNPQSAQDYANVGACLMAMGLDKEAETFFTSAKELDPGLELGPYRKLAGLARR